MHRAEGAGHWDGSFTGRRRGSSWGLEIIPGPRVKSEGGGFRLKIDNARSILLIALDVCSKLWPAAMEGQPSLRVLASPVLSPCSWKEFSLLASQEDLPQAFSSGHQVKGEGHPGSQGWRDPQATLDLLAAFLAAHSQLLIWVCGSEMRARAAKGLANSSLIETAWFEGPLFTLSWRISVCAFFKARKVLATSSFTNTSAGFEERYNNSMKVLDEAHIPTGLNAPSAHLAANWPIQSTDAIIFSY